MTPAGLHLLQQLLPDVTLWQPDTLATVPGCRTYSGALSAHLQTLWPSQQALIFCLATGAVVRLVAPLLQDKTRDPAVVVVDEAGRFVISLCGGHRGGADQLARLVAARLGAQPVLTGASDAAGRVGLDILGEPMGWQRGATSDWSAVSTALARHQPVAVHQESGSQLWRTALPAEHSLVWDGTQTEAQLWITHRLPAFEPSDHAAAWHPRVLWLGVGCERGTPQQVIEQGIEQVLTAHQLAAQAVAGVATLDLKADEMGLQALCVERGWPLRCFSAEALSQVAVPNPSEVVTAAVGTPSVAEAAALLAAAGTLLVPKQVIRQAGLPGAATVAVALAHQEYTGRTGELLLVGTGPGSLEQVTPAARAALVRADAVIGYSLYIELIRPLLRPGQIIEALPITQERARAERAIELAQWGLSVAVVSSGDCGIYGMAGLVLEELRAQGWDGKTPAVEVIPGISALQSAASRLGAPLMQDFCAISLSDLLTPWEAIRRRLEAAAQADFVTALYNPRSRSRLEPLAAAQQIFLQHREPTTPVALVRSAYRDSEQITRTTLKDLSLEAVDMLTLVLIGNRTTRFYGDWLITPRGYLGFEP
ncbi:precorrin-3B C(17)-methyltransferase [Leptolyngbya sp. FACHB-261]|uniref:precorrin-3B C(17)-methyltransferase n=1 Tax=Leptolyngbya sp. FACHB-261 TaxID=2692806 RepID=UPI0028C37718|nr:precorrin-3B C(17)-methyltransferase [Leptolyngbya sp. FACHB-261]